MITEHLIRAKAVVGVVSGAVTKTKVATFVTENEKMKKKEKMSAASRCTQTSPWVVLILKMKHKLCNR